MPTTPWRPVAPEAPEATLSQPAGDPANVDPNAVDPNAVDPAEAEVEPTEDNDNEGLDPKIAAKIDKANREAKNLRDRLKVAEAKASQLDDLKKKDLSEVERLSSEKAALEAQLAELRVDNIRRQAALGAELPESLVEFITGATADEANDQAKRLAKLLKPAENNGETKQQQKPADLKQGNRGGNNAGNTLSRDDLLRQLAGR